MPYDRHQNTDFRCLVWHSDGPACIKCGQCGEWIRPADMDQPCPGGREEVGEQHRQMVEFIKNRRG
jgi:hypothetical protein